LEKGIRKENALQAIYLIFLKRGFKEWRGDSLKIEN
jgi:hypothetical protein